MVFLTRDRGKKRGVAKGARRVRSKFIGALEPMTRAGVAYYEREQRDLVRINYVETDEVAAVAVERGALGHVGYFAELIDEWAPEAHADERLYRLGSSMTDAIADGAAIEPLARYFEYLDPAAAGGLSVARVVRRVRRAADGRRGDAAARRSVRVPDLRAGRRRQPERGGAAIPEGRGGDGADRLEALRFRPRAARELETVHRRLLSLHLEKELKSARVLREMRGAQR